MPIHVRKTKFTSSWLQHHSVVLSEKSAMIATYPEHRVGGQFAMRMFTHTVCAALRREALLHVVPQRTWSALVSVLHTYSLVLESWQFSVTVTVDALEFVLTKWVVLISCSVAMPNWVAWILVKHGRQQENIVGSHTFCDSVRRNDSVQPKGRCINCNR